MPMQETLTETELTFIPEFFLVPKPIKMFFDQEVELKLSKQKYICQGRYLYIFKYILYIYTI